MEELLRTNDLVFLSFLEALLKGDDIEYLVADAFVNAAEGGIFAFPRRVLVVNSDIERARTLMRDADLAEHLR